MSSFDRGFKTWTERSSVSLRSELGLYGHDPLPCVDLAKFLSVELLTPRDIPNLPQNVLKQLIDIDPDGWSAVTISDGQCSTVIYNPAHKKTRQNSDIMHELSHVIIGHEPSKMVLSADGALVMRSFDQKQEDEADWFSGCLILPREALLHSKRLSLSEDEIRDKYTATRSLLRMRLGVTGVNRQLQIARGRR